MSLTSVSHCSSAEAVCGLLDLVKARYPIVDVTYGNGLFWKGQTRQILGGDSDPTRAKDFVASFLALPFADRSIPTIVFDPPFHPSVGTIEEKRFKTLGANEVELKSLFQAGVRECWRASGELLLVKCQDYIHNHAPQWMPLWTIEICGEPFEWLKVERPSKRVSSLWKEPRSVYRNHADYLLFCRLGNKR